MRTLAIIVCLSVALVSARSAHRAAPRTISHHAAPVKPAPVVPVPAEVAPLVVAPPKVAVEAKKDDWVKPDFCKTNDCPVYTVLEANVEEVSR